MRHTNRYHETIPTIRGSGRRNRKREGIHSYARKVRNGHWPQRYDRPALDYTEEQWAGIMLRTAEEAGLCPAASL